MGEMNPYDVARKANNRITPQGVAKIVKGDSDVRIDTLVVLAAALNTTAPELLLEALEPDEGSTENAKLAVEHKRIIEDYDDIPPICQKDVRDLLSVLRKNHSLTERRERIGGQRDEVIRRREVAAAVAPQPNDMKGEGGDAVDHDRTYERRERVRRRA